MAAAIAARPVMGAPATGGGCYESGLHKLAGSATIKDGTCVYVPPKLTSAAMAAAAAAAGPCPLLVMLHGAGGTASGAVQLVAAQAEADGVLVAAPQSQRASWDMISGPAAFGPDVDHLNHLLRHVFSTYRSLIDPRKLAIGGFSDGASYALSVGLANGDLFTHVLAFSPGYMRPPVRRGAPTVFVSHGVADRVLDIDRCSRRIVAALQRDVERAGCPRPRVSYTEFPDGHAVPSRIVKQAFDLFLRGDVHASPTTAA